MAPPPPISSLRVVERNRSIGAVRQGYETRSNVRVVSIGANGLKRSVGSGCIQRTTDAIVHPCSPQACPLT